MGLEVCLSITANTRITTKSYHSMTEPLHLHSSLARNNSHFAVQQKFVTYRPNVKHIIQRLILTLD